MKRLPRFILRKKWLRLLFKVAVVFFVFLNVMIFMHAWKATHFSPHSGPKPSIATMSHWELAKTACTGANIPKPRNHSQPAVPYQSLALNSENGQLAAWLLPQKNAKATVILSHGYGSCMSRMLPYAYVFYDMGYRVLLYDSTGSGDSEGRRCTIGVKEAKDFAAIVEYTQQQYEGEIIAFGASMGAALTMRGIAKEGVEVDAVILQCPFATMQDAIKIRMNKMGLPYTGFGHLMVFWGGLQHGFNAFQHNPKDYATAIEVPALLIWGARDDRVARHETTAIFEQLAGSKQLAILENSGHAGLMYSEPEQWKQAVSQFLGGL